MRQKTHMRACTFRYVQVTARFRFGASDAVGATGAVFAAAGVEAFMAWAGAAGGAAGGAPEPPSTATPIALIFASTRRR